MDALPADMKLAILQWTAVSPLQHLSFHIVRSSLASKHAPYAPLELPSKVFGVRQNARFALRFSAPIRRGFIATDVTKADENAALRHRESASDNDQFCFDVGMTRLCLYKHHKCRRPNYMAEPIGDVQMQLHCTKSPLAATCKAFRDLMNGVPAVSTDCVVPRKFIVYLNAGHWIELKHTIVVVEDGDPDGILRYYHEKEKKGDFEGSDAEDEELPTWGV